VDLLRFVLRIVQKTLGSVAVRDMRKSLLRLNLNKSNRADAGFRHRLTSVGQIVNELDIAARLTFIGFWVGTTGPVRVLKPNNTCFPIGQTFKVISASRIRGQMTASYKPHRYAVNISNSNPVPSRERKWKRGDTKRWLSLRKCNQNSIYLTNNVDPVGLL
jgi:hypothetical protein